MSNRPSQNDGVEEEARRLEEASEWLLCLQDDDMSDVDVARWVDWCQADPDNRKAFQRLMPIWQAFDDRTPTGDSPSLDAFPSVPLKRPSRSWVLRGKASWALAAGVMLALAAALTTVWLASDSASVRLGPFTTLNTQTGHIRAAILPDGSKLDLGARSSIAVEFTGEQRQIEMQDGEAYFAVKPDRRKPFVVRAGSVNVTAIGTQFDVQKARDRVVVTVSEGTVRIAGVGSSALIAYGGNQVIYDTALSAKPTIRTIDPAAAAAWRHGHLEYLSEPLSSVIATANRYTEHAIVLEDPELARLNYTGTIEVGSVDEWVHALPRIFPVEIQKGPQEERRIVRR